MTCEITPEDLGSPFADVDPALAELIIEQATIVVLGPADCQAGNESAYKACCVDPCNMIKLIAQHLLSSLPDTGADGKDVQSERVGDVAITYSSAGSSSSLWSGSAYGRLFQFELSKFEKCKARRRTLPFAVGPSLPPTPSGSCGC